MLQQLSGASAIDSYMQTIIKESKSSISPEASSIIFGVIQIPAVIIAATLVDKAGRRPLLITSALGCALALCSEGFYFYVRDTHVHTIPVKDLSWLPTTGLVLFLIMGPIGLATVPYVLLGELFPTDVKTQAVPLFTILGGILGFIVVKFFEPLGKAWGMYTLFWTLTAVCILGSIFVYCMLPETKGKSFIEIQNELNKNKLM